MTFPSGPNDQGFPEQPAFSQQPGFGVQPPIYSHQPGSGQPGYPGSPQPTPPRGPSGATAIIAGILALLGGLFGVLFGGLFVAVMISDHDSDAIGVVFTLFSFAFGLVLFSGAILLWRRKMTGRWLIVGGCAGAILLGLLAFADFFIGISGAPTHDAGAYVMLAVLGFIFPIATLVLVLLQSTTKWICATPRPQSPAPPGYSPFQGYPPHQGYRG
ncbi:hypothetical protein ACPCIR_15535 [Mycobacterium sp. NPDC051198]